MKKVKKGINDFESLCKRNGKGVLLEEWDFEKNIILPDEVTYRSDKEVFWKCSKGHSWKKKISQRIVGERIVQCPYCTGHRPIEGFNDLKTKYPELAKEWDYEKNTNGPEKYLPGSEYKAFWICPLDHRWAAVINSRTRTRGSGCPICKRKKVNIGENDLKTLFPDIALKWDYNLNEKGPESYRPGSDYKAYWICENGHKWIRRIKNMTHKGGDLCPYCSGKKLMKGKNDLKSLFPEISRDWDYERNENRPEDYFPQSGYKAHWVCPNGHRWQARIYSRTRNDLGCAICSGKRPEKGKNDLKTLFPEVAKEWDYDKNSDRPEDHGSNSSYVAYWKCFRGHSWKTSITKRTQRGDGCPFCYGRYPIPGETDLKTLFPNLIKEWDFEKNKKGMEAYTANSHQKVYWKCNQGHSYIRCISDRTRKDKEFGCPYCSGKKPIVGVNDLKTVNPFLCEEWSDKNITSPEEYTVHSNTKVWWRCSACDHEWIAVITNRSNGWGCPNCSKMRRLRRFND